MHLPVTRNPWSMRSAVKSQQRTPTPIPRLLLISCIVAAAACGTHGNSDLTGDWEGTVTEEDGTTIVCTTAGSVWGQRAQLEELLTLDEGRHGPPLADVRGIAAAGDRFYVLDVEEGALQVYDTTGLYLETIGRSGEGPGEFRRPVDLAVDPIRDRLYVRDAQLRRISVFRLDGSLVTTWNTPTIPGLLRPMVLTQGGELYVASNLNPTAVPAVWRRG